MQNSVPRAHARIEKQVPELYLSLKQVMNSLIYLFHPIGLLAAFYLII